MQTMRDDHYAERRVHQMRRKMVRLAKLLPGETCPESFPIEVLVGMGFQLEQFLMSKGGKGWSMFWVDRDGDEVEVNCMAKVFGGNDYKLVFSGYPGDMEDLKGPDVDNMEFKREIKNQ